MAEEQRDVDPIAVDGATWGALAERLEQPSAHVDGLADLLGRPSVFEEATDDDPEVVAGMKRLAELRELEQDIPEIGADGRMPL